MTSAWTAILVLLACAVSSTALTTPHFVARQASATNSSSLCTAAGLEPNAVAAASLTVGNGTIEFGQFSCEAPVSSTSPGVAAHDCAALPGVWSWLDGILYFFFPSLDCAKAPPAKPTTSTKTVTKATTATKTDTVTSVSVSLITSVSATTATATEVTTATATELTTLTDTEVTTATDLTTVVSSATETDVVTVTTTASAAAPTETGTNVCGAICTNVCNEFGQLPPTTDDCQALVNSITILNGQISPTFTVDPNHVQTITFGTCRFFFENLGPDPLTYCWLDFVQIASAAASQCLPPTQPVLSEGLCIARDSTWEVGVAHS
ncbi:hypothetical protein BD309DRAFT_957398 [Dichomitus squalens]|uniref:Uncharacterized protein n=1 Tax=Dichomitus squalens TaxID=114155 RepID=A0A4Q9NU75_9APHY|nr:hypothetical protein BD311DRAFT_757628 [Dichomitus squalens]TBU44918.1 hypothetical protein BD309DRAFT_957398 [Dichomitus squalens]TBU54773.1 hypothetical protein BD310DRAFT_935055 [Dichomitus squalens]